MADRSRADLGMISNSEAPRMSPVWQHILEARKFGNYFLKQAREYLDAGHSVSDTAWLMGTDFKQLWDFFRLDVRQSKFPKKELTMLDWLERETDEDARRILLGPWLKIVMEVLRTPPRHRDVVIQGIAYRRGIKLSLLRKMLKDGKVIN